MKLNWYSHKDEIERVLAEVEPELCKRIKLYTPSIELMMGLVQWAELKEALALHRTDERSTEEAKAYRVMSAQLKRITDKALPKKQEDES